MPRVRADVLLVTRGLAESRAQARAAIESGGVSADGRSVARPSELIEDSANLAMQSPHPWVSRGGMKLSYALDAFGIDPKGRVCIDIGASTGGFTDVLLARGATRVYAVDVGVAQLHPRIDADPRVLSHEDTDARLLTRAEIPEPPSLVVCDVSFIGAGKALAIPLTLAATPADLVVLIKPQFEIGPGRRGKHGVLPEDLARAAAGAAIANLDGLEGFRAVSFCDSPIRGGEGNLELLLHARRT
jgi:23S rRNA (cytidine1920-2'-O)/16S rRNA (cytidine1409-2'-O)-methyltransferase